MGKTKSKEHSHRCNVFKLKNNEQSNRYISAAQDAAIDKYGQQQQQQQESDIEKDCEQ